MATLRATLLGVGAMNSPRFAPAGLLVRWQRRAIMFDGGPGAEPPGRLAAWLVTDERGELRASLRRLAAAHDVVPATAGLEHQGLSIEPLPVVHTNHPTCGFRLRVGDRLVVWAPEFLEFPQWADGADLMFAEAAGWNRRILFRGGAGGHASVLETCEEAKRRNVRRLIFAHIGRPAIRAIDAGLRPPIGQWGVEGRTYMAAAPHVDHEDAATTRRRPRT